LLIYIYRDKTQRVVQGTLELSKVVDANGIHLTTSSDFSLKLQDFPPPPLTAIPQLKSMGKFFYRRFLKNFKAVRFGNLLILLKLKCDISNN